MMITSLIILSLLAGLAFPAPLPDIVFPDDSFNNLITHRVSKGKDEI